MLVYSCRGNLAAITLKMEISKCSLWESRFIKPGFHIIVPIALVILNNFETIWTTGTIIGGFHVIIRVIASMARDTGSSVISLGQTIEFLHGFRKQANHTCNDGF